VLDLELRSGGCRNEELCGSIDPDHFEEMPGSTSERFQPPEHQRIAVKAIDFRGKEVVRVVGWDEPRTRSGG